MKVGIKGKLIIFTSSLLFIVIFILSIFVLRGIKVYQSEEEQKILVKQKDMFEQCFIDKINEDENFDKPQLVRGTIFNRPWLRNIPSCLYNTDGTMLSGFNNDADIDENDSKDEMIKYAQEGKVVYKTVNNVIYYYSPLKYKDNIIAILELKYSISDRVQFYNNIKNMFFVIGFLSLSFGIIVGIIYFSQFTKEIYSMRNYVRNIQGGNFNEALFSKRNDELGELSKGLINMSDTIEKNLKDLQIEKDSLSRAVKKLRKMDKKQKEFIGNVTHEFKTPITIIRASGDLMKMYPEDLDLIEESTNKIAKECDRLEELVENVLKLSALEKYDFEEQKKDVNLKILLSKICDRMKGRMDRNNLKLKCSFQSIVINIDEESLKHIIINIIDNAIKYSKAFGSISIACYKEKNTACIEVCDDGIGIEKEKLSKIFEPFYRIDKNRSRKSGGAGLGLALVKNMVEKQGGIIEVQSTPNKGSRFIIKFIL